jgi:hypothetical protein
VSRPNRSRLIQLREHAFDEFRRASSCFGYIIGVKIILFKAALSIRLEDELWIYSFIFVVNQ